MARLKIAEFADGPAKARRPRRSATNAEAQTAFTGVCVRLLTFLMRCERGSPRSRAKANVWRDAAVSWGKSQYVPIKLTQHAHDTRTHKEPRNIQLSTGFLIRLKGAHCTKTTIDHIANVPLRPKLLNKICAHIMRHVQGWCGYYDRLTVAMGCPIGFSMMLSKSVPMQNAMTTLMAVKVAVLSEDVQSLPKRVSLTPAEHTGDANRTDDGPWNRCAGVGGLLADVNGCIKSTWMRHKRSIPEEQGTSPKKSRTNRPQRCEEAEYKGETVWPAVD